MFGIGVTELVLILIIALIIFGPGKLPKVGQAIGKSINEFKKAASGTITDETLGEGSPEKDEEKPKESPKQIT